MGVTAQHHFQSTAFLMTKEQYVLHLQDRLKKMPANKLLARYKIKVNFPRYPNTKDYKKLKEKGISTHTNRRRLPRAYYQWAIKKLEGYEKPVNAG